MSAIQVLQINSGNDLVLAAKQFGFLAGLYSDNGGASNGPAYFPNDPGFLTIEQEQQVIDAGFGKWTKVWHFSNDEIAERYKIVIDDLSDPDGYALDRIEAAVESEGFSYAHFTSTGDWYLEAPENAV